MALQKDKLLNNGFTANYWKIHSIREINVDTSVSKVLIALYKDSTTRDAGINKYSAIYEVSLNGDDFPFTISAQDVADKNTSKLFYDKVKTISNLALNDDSSNTIDFTTGTVDV